MHKPIILFIIFSLLLFNVPGQANTTTACFDFGRSLRIDFVLTGNNRTQTATISSLLETSVYSGSPEQLLPPFDLGQYRLLLLDAQSQDTLFIKGFCTLFEEWQTTGEATRVSRAMKQTVEAPMPLIPVTLIVEFRNRSGQFSSLIHEEIDPEATRFEKIVPPQYPHRLIHGINNPAKQTDLLFIAEGYRPQEADLFFTDVQRLTDYLFSIKPYSHLKEQITIRALATPSIDSGTDDPNRAVWKNTALNSSFNTFNTDRYLESYDAWAIYNQAAALPHDHIIVLVNSEKYGGGGIYNHFSIASARHKTSPQVFVHELGHGLAGLGDEYYSSNVAYSDYYDLNTEPWQPNLTTLINFESKWKDLLPDSIPVPTPATEKYTHSTGVFEGGGYSAKGIYRPAMNCRMKTNEAPGFCEVCQASIRQIVLFLTL